MVVECDAKLLGAWVAGALTETKRSAIASHAATCARCHALLAGLVDTTAESGRGAASGEPCTCRDPDTASKLERGSDTRAEPYTGPPPVRGAAGPPEFRGTDRFSVVRRIGAGGMGVVYEVWDREREAAVALKTLRSLSPHRLSLFKNEFRALRGLSHRNLVSLGELRKDRDHWFFTMELVDGEPFLSWVYPDHPETGVRFDEARLRDGLRQLACALRAMHRAGKVHSDIKPSNVLVTRDGRVVVLDFGLVRDVRDPDDAAGHLMGTPAYMAPEQGSRSGFGPEADWYAVGVMLYEALTGQRPFDGPIAVVLAVKRGRLPDPPSMLANDVPADLDELCMRLLAIDPAERAGADEVLRAVGGGAGGAGGAGDAALDEPALDEAFLGRGAELAALDAALEAGGPLMVAVRGESGAGKSTLLGRWLARAASGGAVVLAGRCCERESVPYKAIDGVIEALARWLAGQPAEVVRELAPPRAKLLARVFPALEALAPSPRPGSRKLEPATERRHLFEAVRALLGRIAERHRLVVGIDDLHWADADSLALLTALLRPPAAPPLVLVIAERADERAGFEPPCPVREIEVGPLAPADAAALAATLLPVATPAAAAEVAAEAGGHPLFVMELARAWGRRAAAPRLDDALARRIEALAPESRDIVEVVSVAGAPVAQAVIAEAAGVALGPLAAVLVRLRDDHLVRSGGLGREDRVDAYHSRVRTAVLQQLAPPRARSIHARLAAALERRPAVDPEQLFEHWRQAGDGARARRYAIAAADAAADALAFDRAARLYRAALELGDEDGLALRDKLGAALVNAGRGADAARVFQEAAAGAGAREALDLRRRAAEQLLRSGHVDAGIEALGEVLGGVGMRLPATGRTAISSLLVERARLRLRGLALRRGGGGYDPGTLARVDACMSAATGLALIDLVRAAMFQSRALRLALDAGDPGRAVIALALDVCLLATRGARLAPRVDAILAHARALAAECGEPYAHGIVAAAAGISAHLQGRFAEGLAALEEGERIMGPRVGATWERDSLTIYIAWSQVYLGRFAALAARVPDALRDAEERDDRCLATALRAGALVWLALARGDTAGVRIELEEGIRRWSERGFLLNHWSGLFARAELDLYGGDAEGVLARLPSGWRSLERAHAMRIQLFRANAFYLRGRAALRRATQVGAATPSGRDLLGPAAADAARLYRERVPYISALGDLLSAGIAAARSDRPAATALLRRALAACDATGLALHAAVARLRLADLVGGSEGDALRAAALSYAAREQVTAVSALTEHLAPGFTIT